MVSKQDRDKRGVGMQGFYYAPGLTEFAHIINIHSPRAYQAIRNILPMPTARSLQYVTFKLLISSCSQNNVLPESTVPVNHDSQ
jgi:hypothetical protein